MVACRDAVSTQVSCLYGIVAQYLQQSAPRLTRVQTARLAHDQSEPSEAGLLMHLLTADTDSTADVSKSVITPAPGSALSQTQNECQNGIGRARKAVCIACAYME